MLRSFNIFATLTLFACQPVFASTSLCDNAPIDKITKVETKADLALYPEGKIKPERFKARKLKHALPITVNAITVNNYLYMKYEGKCYSVSSAYFKLENEKSCVARRRSSSSVSIAENVIEPASKGFGGRPCLPEQIQ